MECKSQEQAERVARAGSAKMAGRYTLKNSRLKALQGRQFTVVNNESGARYVVSIDPAKTFCSCPFWRRNRQFRICKHVCFMQEMADWQASIIAREAALEV